MIATYRQPVLVEPFLTGREFTVGIVGTGPQAQVLGTVEIHLLAEAEENMYSYLNKAHYEQRVTYRLMPSHGDRLVKQTEEIALAAWRVLGCRDAGRVDLRCDAAGNPQFMEVNPLAGLHPVHSDLPIICNRLAIPYSFLIEKIVASAKRRAWRSADRAASGEPMRVTVVYNQVTASGSPDEADVLAQVAAATAAMGRLGHDSRELPCTLDLGALEDALRRHPPDLVFNLAESLGGHARLIHAVPFLLECHRNPLHRVQCRGHIHHLAQGAGQTAPGRRRAADAAVDRSAPARRGDGR